MLLFPKDSLVYKDTLIESKTIRTMRPIRVGIGGSYGINYYRDGSLPSPLSTSCDTFKTGKGNGLNFLGRVDFPLGDEDGKFYVSPVLSYENFSADHTWGEFGPARNSSGVMRQVEFDHVITNTTKAIGAKFLCNWQFFKPFSFEAGPAFYYLFDQQFTKTEYAIHPGDLIVTSKGDSVRQQLEASGTLPNAKSFLAALSFSLGAEVPLSKKLSADLNIEYLFPLTQIHSRNRFDVWAQK